MQDPGAPAKSKGWPLLAISLLVVLLAGFLIVRWRKKEDVPALVKEPPAAAAAPQDPAKPDDPSKPVAVAPVKPGPETPAVAPAPADAEFEQKVKDLKKALESSRWDEAAAAFEAAKKLKPDAPDLKGVEGAIAEGRKKEEAERVELAKKAEL
jgi:hypothetical protein